MQIRDTGLRQSAFDGREEALAQIAAEQFTQTAVRFHVSGIPWSRTLSRSCYIRVRE